MKHLRSELGCLPKWSKPSKDYVVLPILGRQTLHPTLLGLDSDGRAAEKCLDGIRKWRYSAIDLVEELTVSLLQHFDLVVALAFDLVVAFVVTLARSLFELAVLVNFGDQTSGASARNQ